MLLFGLSNASWVMRIFQFGRWDLALCENQALPLLIFLNDSLPSLYSFLPCMCWLVFSWLLEGDPLRACRSLSLFPIFHPTNSGCLNLLRLSESAGLCLTSPCIWPGTSPQAARGGYHRSFLVCFSSLRDHCLLVFHSSVLHSVHFECRANWVHVTPCWLNVQVPDPILVSFYVSELVI